MDRNSGSTNIWILIMLTALAGIGVCLGVLLSIDGESDSESDRSIESAQISNQNQPMAVEPGNTRQD